MLLVQGKNNTPVGEIVAFVVTGRLYRSNKRFVNRYLCEDNSKAAQMTAMSINLWNGSVWAELESGKRKLLKRVTN
jgi:5-keto 4-deoxyuronate isomerase